MTEDQETYPNFQVCFLDFVDPLDPPDESLDDMSLKEVATTIDDQNRLF